MSITDTDHIVYTTADDIIQSFESSFANKKVLPHSLEIEWLRKAIGRYSLELDRLNFDDEILQFDCKLDRYAIDTLAQFMKQYYMERQWSEVNKRVSVVGKDVSIGGSDNSKKYTQEELIYTKSEASTMVGNQKPTAYA